VSEQTNIQALAVKYHNDVNSVSLQKFTSKELDILMTIMSRMRDHGEDEITFTFDYLKRLVRWQERKQDTKTFALSLDRTYQKLIQCNIRIGDDRHWVRFVLFTRYAVDLDKQLISIRVNSEFRFVLNELSSNFTRFELEEFTGLKSSYTKEFYRRMKQFRSTGYWKVSFEEFKRLLDIPGGYLIRHIDAKVFAPIMAELSEKYHLEIKKLYEKHGRGRPRVSGFEFTFDKSPLPELLETLPEEVQKTKQKPKKSQRDMKFYESRYRDRTIRIYDEKFQRYNYLKIVSIEHNSDGFVSVSVQNIDDDYKNTMHFDSVRIWDGYFKKYAV
jgi:putative replication protein rep